MHLERSHLENHGYSSNLAHLFMRQQASSAPWHPTQKAGPLGWSDGQVTESKHRFQKQSIAAKNHAQKIKPQNPWKSEPGLILEIKNKMGNEKCFPFSASLPPPHFLLCSVPTLHLKESPWEVWGEWVCAKPWEQKTLLLPGDRTHFTAWEWVKMCPSVDLSNQDFRFWYYIIK